VEKRVRRTVGDHFLAKVPKNVRLDAFHLETCLVFDDSPRVETRRSLGPDGRVEQEARFR
jgi:hypothetical protein